MKKKKQSSVKEICSKCGGDQFAISQDIRQTRYCDVCKHVWLPKSQTELELDQAKQYIIELEKRVRELESEQAIPPKSKSTSANPAHSLKGEDLFG